MRFRSPREKEPRKVQCSAATDLALSLARARHRAARRNALEKQKSQKGLVSASLANAGAEGWAELRRATGAAAQFRRAARRGADGGGEGGGGGETRGDKGVGGRWGYDILNRCAGVPESSCHKEEEESIPCEPSEEKLVRTLEVLRVNLLQLQGVDHAAQTFGATVLFHFRMPGGALDEDLMCDLHEKDAEFPKDTGRPGAKWFLQQVDFPTALDYTMQQQKAVQIGSDLDIVVRVRGTFFESMELEDFPVDLQRLTVVIAFNCANEGVVPLRFGGLQNVAHSVNTNTFALANVWYLHPSLVLERAVLELMPGRTYPALNVTAIVERRPNAFLTNAVLPVGVLGLISLSTFLLPYDDTADRMELSITILLTSATYKLFTAASIPEVAYWTLLDRYIISNFLIMTHITINGAVIGYFDSQEAHVVLAILNTFFYVVAHARFAYGYSCARRNNAMVVLKELGFEINDDVFERYHRLTATKKPASARASRWSRAARWLPASTRLSRVTPARLSRASRQCSTTEDRLARPSSGPLAAVSGEPPRSARVHPVEAAPPLPGSAPAEETSRRPPTLRELESRGQGGST